MYALNSFCDIRGQRLSGKDETGKAYRDDLGCNQTGDLDEVWATRDSEEERDWIEDVS